MLTQTVHLILLFCTFFSTSTLSAQTTGKISGYVKDFSNQKPLSGVNIVIKSAILLSIVKRRLLFNQVQKVDRVV